MKNFLSFASKASLKVGVVLLGLLGTSCGDVRFGEDAASPVFLSKFVHINDGAKYTRHRGVTLSLQGGFAVEMFISSTPDCKTGRWEPFAPVRQWRLPRENAEVSVYVKFRTDKKAADEAKISADEADDTHRPDEQACYAASIIHDNTPPQIILNKTHAAQQVLPVNKIELNFEAQDAVSGLDQVQCALGERTRYELCAGNGQAVYSELQDGPHVLRIRARDKAGNESVQAYARVVDTQAPEIKWLSKAPPLQAIKSASFEVQATDATTEVVGLQCRRGVRGAWRSCKSSVQLKRLMDGEHLFSIRAIDKAGHKSQILKHKWRVDTVAPSLQVDAERSIAAITRQAFGRVVFEARDLRTDGSKSKLNYVCVQGQGEAPDAEDSLKTWPGAQACSPDFRLTDLADGRAYVLVQAIDEAGNKSTIQKHVWRVDTRVPVVKIDAASSVERVVNRVEAQVLFSAADERADGSSSQLKLLCKVNKAAFKACRSPLKVNWLSDGQHTVFIQAIDEAGNKSIVQQHLWRIDTKVPKVQIDADRSIASITQQTSGRVTFGGTDARTDASASELSFVCLQGQGQVPAVGSELMKGAKACSGALELEGLQDGAGYVLVQAIDEAGNKSAIQQHIWRVDTRAPSVRIDTKQSVGLEVNTHQAQVAFSASDKRADGSGSQLRLLCQHATASQQSESFVACQSPWQLEGLQDGLQSVRVKAVDEAGNESPVQVHTWRVDTRAPVVNVDPVQSVAKLVNTASVQVVFEASDERSDGSASQLNLLCRQGEGGEFKLCQSPLNLENLSDGVHITYIKAIDKAGNESYIKNHQWRVDTRAPVIRIDAAKSVAAISKSTEAQVFFSGVDERADGSASELSFKCLAGQGPVERGSAPISDSIPSNSMQGAKACADEFELKSLSDGRHYVLVQATDAAGNKSAIQKHMWRVDTQAPVVSIDVAKSVSVISKSTEAQVFFSGVDERADGSASELRFKCLAGQGPIAQGKALSRNMKGAQDCSGALKLETLADGRHYVLVQATDAAGNKSEIQQHLWRVDTRAPVVRIDVGKSVAAISKLTEARVIFSGVDERADGSASELSFKCLAGQGPVAQGKTSSRNMKGAKVCADEFELKSLSDGRHYVLVQATDAAGNTSPIQKHMWRVDTQAPVVSINVAKSVSAISKSTEAQVFFSGVDERADGSASELSFKCLAGKESLGLAEHDLAAQSTSSSMKGAQACADEFELKTLSDGRHYVLVQATDAAGNTSAIQKHIWRVDTQAPVVSIDVAKSVSSISKSTEAQVFFSGVDERADGSASELSFKCLHGQRSIGKSTSGDSMKGAKACSGVFELKSLPDAHHYVLVQATDAAGNTSSIQKHMWRVDTQAPVTTIDVAQSIKNLTNKTVASVVFSSTDAGAAAGDTLQHLCAKRTGSNKSLPPSSAYKVCQSPFKLSDLKDGTHRVFVKARDMAGNESPAVHHTWQIDTQAPVLSFTSKPSSFVKTKQNAFAFKASDLTKVSYECALFKANKVQIAWSACTSPQKYTLSDAAYRFEVRARDEVGNISKSQKWSWVVDTVAPTLSWLVKPAPVVGGDAVISFKIKVSDNVSGLKEILCALDGGAFKSCGREFSFANESGPHKVRVKLRDKAGNESKIYEASWVVDDSRPIVSIDTARSVAAITNSTEARVWFEVRDVDGTQVSSADVKVYCQLSGGQVQTPCSSPQTFTKLKDAAYGLKVWAIDAVGNKSLPVEHKWLVDSTAPQLTAALEEEAFLGGEVRIRIEAEDAGSAVDRVECQHKGRPVPCSVAEGLRVPADELGPDSAKLWAIDKAGNKSQAVQVSWVVQAKLIDMVHDVRIEGRDLDVLFVVDNSDSMREEQAELASKIGGFLSTLQDVDYHVGITTTDLHKLNRSGTDGRLFPIKALQGQNYVDRSIDFALAQQYLANTFVQIGIQGSLSEDGLGAAVRMLERWRSGDAELVNFLRPEAHLSVVVISDANSIASKPHHTPTGVIRLVRRTWPNKKFVWNSIVATMQSVRTPGCTFEALGKQYESLSSRTSGIIGSICDPSYTNVLSQMGQRVLNMHKSFLLECEVAELKTGFKFSVWRKTSSDTYEPYDVDFEIEYDEVLLSDFLPEGEYQFRFKCFE